MCVDCAPEVHGPFKSAIVNRGCARGRLKGHGVDQGARTTVSLNAAPYCVWPLCGRSLRSALHGPAEVTPRRPCRTAWDCMLTPQWPPWPDREYLPVVWRKPDKQAINRGLAKGRNVFSSESDCQKTTIF